mmetsp:Transcript_12153/g.17717  ORF Transcript_12153/g.17717 Transcript_12153/m.17717 type:complete len:91 (+) Transcript_12153:1949-2221(+)
MHFPACSKSASQIEKGKLNPSQRREKREFGSIAFSVEVHEDKFFFLIYPRRSFRFYRNLSQDIQKFNPTSLNWPFQFNFFVDADYVLGSS